MNRVNGYIVILVFVFIFSPVNEHLILILSLGKDLDSGEEDVVDHSSKVTFGLSLKRISLG